MKAIALAATGHPGRAMPKFISPMGIGENIAMPHLYCLTPAGHRMSMPYSQDHPRD